MSRIRLALAGLLSLVGIATASAQQFPTVGYNTVIGRLGAHPGDTGPSQQIPFATLEAQFGTNGIPGVTIESQHGGCTVSDNTAALLSAVNSVSGPVRVLFPNNCTYNFTQASAINFTKEGVYLEGASKFSTALQFQPSTDGPFLQWSNGVNEIYGGGISKLSILSTDTTHTKVMVQWYDVSNFDAHDIFCSGGVLGSASQLTGGAGSQCIYSHGRDTTTVSNVYFQAQIPLHIGMNPHWYGSADHYHFSDMYLVSDIGSGTHPVILVDPGVVFTNTTFDGYESWNGGTHGFYYPGGEAADFVSAVVSGGAGYTNGQMLTVAGGTCSTPIQLQVLNAVGGVIQAPPAGVSIANPGVCSVTPSNPVSVTTGSATFNLGLVAGYRLSFANVRTEQGSSGAADSFFISPAAQLQGLTISNSDLDGVRCGVFLKNTLYATIQQSTYLSGGCGTAVNATFANSNDMLSYKDNFWQSGTTQTVTGMTAVNLGGSPPGTSATVPPTALYSSTISGTTFQALGIAGVAVFNGSSGATTVQAAATASGTAVLPAPAGTDTIVARATTDTLTNKTIDTAAPNTIKINGNSLSAPAGTATVTVPNSTDTLVARATADILTNKTISGINNTLTVRINGDVSGLGSGVPAALGGALNTAGGPAAVLNATPAIVDGSGAALSLTLSQEGYQVGNMVHQLVSVTYPSTASGATAQLNGLAVTVPNRTSAAQCFVTSSSAGFGMLIKPIVNTKNLQMFTSGNVAVTNTNLTGATVNFECIYPAT
ncbi:hypothetical protein [Bradyrhizobium erythrophlei]|uniref:Uncharacterized protein n=1 Tax=Bradyrhizobium erythrophlei TaxID=1437360 RepID=A0A1M5SHG2_9BRAD|nr:hypothetical protein [Bradyrhizobium erythrophlei]SHH37984.1 hypothetical protein SAMN05443248_4611 [Bradyrhizobium erythrophlei]